MSAMQEQLDQVNAALAGMPGNEMLLKLKADIEEGMKLEEELAPAATAAPVAAAAAAPAAAAARYRPGQSVQAKASADGMMYEATVQSVGADGSYTVIFAAGSSETVSASDCLPPKTANPKAERAQTISGETGRTGSAGVLSTDTAAQRAAKKKAAKGKRSYERRKEQEETLNAGKKNWKDFMNGAKGSKKKGASRGIARKSIFTTPDTLDGRVGVTGSGAGMTDFGSRKKHKHNGVEDAD